MRTWARWRASGSERPIGIEDYEAVGGFAGALNRHADELLSSDAVRADPKIAEIVFKRLTALGRGNRERRDPAPLSELRALCNAESGDQRRRVNAVIDVFRTGEATFLTPRNGELKHETYIDITHESLIRNWKILAEKWLPEEEAQARTLIELRERARGWRAGNRALLVGLDLAGALKWDSGRNRSAKWAEHYAGIGAIEEVEEFLSASRSEFEKVERRKRAAARRTLILSYVLAGLLITAIVFAVIAWRASIRASHQEKLAESRESAAEAEELMSLGRRGEALDAAIRALAFAATSEAREAAASSFPQELTRLGHSDSVLGAAFSPDGQHVVTAADETARVWNAATGQLVAKLEASGAVFSAAFSPDGQRVVTAGVDPTARVWDAATGQTIARLVGHSAIVRSAEFSRDGRQVVTASDDRTARVWNAATGQAIAKLEGHLGGVNSAAFSPDGQRVVTASSDRAARVWDAATGQAIAKLEGHSGEVNSAAFSPDGQRVVTASDDKTARVWNAATGQAIVKLEGHSDRVTRAAFSPDGQRIVTAGDDKTARVWNAATGQLIAKLGGHSGPVTSAAFSPDGGRVVTSSQDKTARVWDAATGRVIAKLEGHFGTVWDAAFSPDGQRVVTAGDDKTARVWNIAAAGYAIAKLEGRWGEFYLTAFSPDGQRVVTAGKDGRVRVMECPYG
jgi:WD40 repeat protein